MNEEENPQEEIKLVERPFIRIYDIPVEVRMQSHGSVCRIYLQGKDFDIESTYNGLYNLRGTDGKLNWISPAHAFIWSTEHRMKCFFFNQYDLKHSDWHWAHKFCEKRLDKLKATHYIYMQNEEAADVEEYKISPKKNKPELSDGGFQLTGSYHHAFA